MKLKKERTFMSTFDSIIIVLKLIPLVSSQGTSSLFP